jgi:hypothetical protein
MKRARMLGLAACIAFVGITLDSGLADLLAQAPQTPPAGGAGAAAPGGRGQGRGGRGAGGGADAQGRGGRGQTPAAQEPVDTGKPDLAGIWNGGGGARPANSETVPWGKDNFPVLNERGLAFQKIFDEAIAQKYDCVPSSSPALQYDPYHMQVIQWPDRVIIRYEKDDQTRTIWLDGRKPTVHDWDLQGFSVGRYEGNALIVVTTHFPFDITGFDDYNGIPSSSMKKVTERYWKENGANGTPELRLTLTVEDPLFLRKPASYTTRWLPGRPGYQLNPWDCDPEASRAPIKMMVPKYK